MSTNIGFASDLGIESSQIMAFYSEHWVRKIALSDYNFHQWQFVDPPLNGGDNSCVVAVKENVLLGVMGLNKRNFYISGKAKNGAELTTWVVDKNIKGSGAGAKILNFITDSFDYLLGMGISQDALPIYLRSDFRYLRYIPRYIFVVDKQQILNISEHAPYARKVVKSCSIGTNKVEYEKIQWSQVEFQPIVEGNHFSRTLEDLIWRYDKHPYFHYLTFRIHSNNSPDGYVVLRSEITEDVKMLCVIDILGGENSYKSSIEFIENYAIENGYWAVDMFSTYSNLNKHFLMRGWLSAVDDSFINVPHLYYPLEVRNPATTSLIYWSKEHELDSFDVSNLYVTKQDADLDRPTMNFIENAK